MERGSEMKITVIGALTVVVLMVLLALLADRLATELDRNRQKNDEQPKGSF